MYNIIHKEYRGVNVHIQALDKKKCKVNLSYLGSFEQRDAMKEWLEHTHPVTQKHFLASLMPRPRPLARKRVW